MICIDTSVFLHAISPNASAPLKDGQAVTRCRERIDHFLKALSDRQGKVVLPTPVLSESLVSLGMDALGMVEALRRRAAFLIADFDEKAAVECAILISEHWQGGAKALRDSFSRHRIKFDLQIVAIARVCGAGEILTDDNSMRKVAELCGMPSRGIGDLPLPPEPDQLILPNCGW